MLFKEIAEVGSVVEAQAIANFGQAPVAVP